jgi:tetratricopeptide (TPR) repeat protein
MFPLRAGRELNCEFVLCGGLSWSGKHCRVSVRLLQVNDGLCRWAEDYSRDAADIFRIQEEIALQIARAICDTILPPGNQNSHLVTDPATYCKFLDAVSFMNELSETAFQKAIDLFEDVRKLDSSFAPAYASNAIILAFAGQYGPLYPDVVYTRVNDLASRALALAPELPEAHVALGMARMFHQADFDGAEDSFRRALALNPSNVLANQLFSQLCTVLCRHSESIAAMQRALELDPLSPTVGTLLACVYFFAGHFEPALEQINRVLQIAPGCSTALASAGWVLTEMGHHDLALDRYHRALDVQPQSPIMMANLAYGLAAAGQSQAALRLLHRVIDVRRKAWVSSYWIALVYSRLRLTDKARAWFKRAEEDHDGWRILSNTDPRFQSPSAQYLHIVSSRDLVIQ